MEIGAIHAVGRRERFVEAVVDNNCRVLYFSENLKMWVSAEADTKTLNQLVEAGTIDLDVKKAAEISKIVVPPRWRKRLNHPADFLPALACVPAALAHTELPELSSLKYEEAKAHLGPDLQFAGAKQQDLGPEMMGMTLRQLFTIREDSRFEAPVFTAASAAFTSGCAVDMNREGGDIYATEIRHGMNMYDVKDKIITPDTKGTGKGYALMKNEAKPLRARIMVSHAWLENYDDFLNAIACFSEPGPFWVCAFAIYQPEDIADLCIVEQLGSDVMCGPFATVLKQADMMLGVVTSRCNIYTRLWCVFEMNVALELNVRVRMVQNFERTEYNFSEALLGCSNSAVESESAACGSEGDKEMIHEAIAESGGFDKIDIAVEKVRLQALQEYADCFNPHGLGCEQYMIEQYASAIKCASERVPGSWLRYQSLEYHRKYPRDPNFRAH